MVAFPSLAVTDSDNLTPAGSGTYYLPFSGYLITATTVGYQTIRIPKAGRLKNPRFVVEANAALGDITLALFLNGAVVAGASVVIPAGTSGVFSPAWDVAVSAGDLVCYRMVRIGNSGAFKMTAAQIDYEADDGTATGWILSSCSEAVIASAELSWMPASMSPWSIWNSRPNYASQVLAGENVPWRTNATVTAIRVPWVTGSTTGVVTIAFAKNGTAEITATLPAGSPTVVRQTGSVALAPGDNLSVILDSRLKGSNNIRVGMLQIDVVWSAAEYELVSQVSVNSTGSYSTPGVDNFRPPTGLSRLNPSPTEAATTVKIADASRVHNLRGQQYLAPRASDWPTLLRKNGADTALRFTNPAGANGSYFFENTADEVILAAGDLISIADRVPAGTGPNSGAIGVRLSVLTVTLGTTPPQEITAPTGSLKVTGAAPVLLIDEIVTASPGSLKVTGAAPIIASTETVDAPAGALTVVGNVPTLALGIFINPPPGGLIVAPGAPEVLIYTESAALASQVAALAIAEIVPVARTSQIAVLALGEVIPPVAVSQQAVLILADAHPCVSRLCQVWLMRRTDGVEFAFTSHDEPVQFMGRTFTPCNSLNPSATEAASDMASIGNMELTGIIDDDGISEFDLYAGKFDNCRVDVWEIPWSGSFPHPIRLASGTTGSVSHGRDGFKGEVLGPGAKMQQQSITQVVTAACRFTFGDSRCAKDLGPLTTVGAVSAVASAAPFRTFRSAALVGIGPEGYFARGVVTWTSGPNAGLKSEVKEYDPATGTLVLWNLLPAKAVPGHAFTVTPGCTLAKGGDMGCVYWGNLINFGGFPDVPGDDATSETPIAKI